MYCPSPSCWQFHPCSCLTSKVQTQGILLPDSVWVECFHYALFRLCELPSLLAVCKEWHRLALDPSAFWHLRIVTSRFSDTECLTLAQKLPFVRNVKLCVDQLERAYDLPLSHWNSIMGAQISEISNMGLQFLCGGLTGLEELSLSGCDITDVQCLSALTSLTSLDLSMCLAVASESFLLWCQSYSSRGLSTLQELNISLTRISLSCVNLLTSLISLTCTNSMAPQEQLDSPLARLENLEILNLNWNNNITDRVALTFTSLVKLRSLDLSRCEVSNASLCVLLRSLPQLLECRIHEFQQDRDQTDQIDLLASLATCRELVSLSMTNDHWPRTAVGALLESLPNLTNLELCASVEGEDVAVCTSLQSLDLSCKELTDITALSVLSELTSLQLNVCSSLSIESFMSLSNLLSLETLSFERCGQVNDNCLLLHNLSNLTSLDCSECKQLTSQGLECLPPSVICLRLEGCANLRSLAFLRGVPALRQLDIASVPVTNQSVIDLLHVPLLQSLILSSPLLSDIRVLAHLSCLQGLSLAGCVKLGDDDLQVLVSLPLRALSLSWCTRITDSTLLLVTNLHQLELLEFAGCVRLTGAGLSSLASLSHLRHLDLRGKGISLSQEENPFYLSLPQVARGLDILMEPADLREGDLDEGDISEDELESKEQLQVQD